MEKSLLQKLGLLGIVSFLSYTAALSSSYNVCEVLCTMMVCGDPGRIRSTTLVDYTSKVKNYIIKPLGDKYMAP